MDYSRTGVTFRADSNNLPSVDTVMLMEFVKSSDKHDLTEIRAVKTLLSTKESYIDTAVGYVTVRREDNGICKIKAKLALMPEAELSWKYYEPTACINEKTGVIEDTACRDCSIRDGNGGCSHTLILLHWLQKRNNECPDRSESYWKKPFILDKEYATLKELFPSQYKETPPPDPSVFEGFMKEMEKRPECHNSLIYRYWKGRNADDDDSDDGDDELKDNYGDDYDCDLQDNDDGDVNDDDDDPMQTSSSAKFGNDFGYECSNCKEDIIDFRYVCVQCEDIDLCKACEELHDHDTHYVLRIPPGSRPRAEVDELVSCVRQAVTRVLYRPGLPVDVPEPEIKTEMKEENVDPLEEGSNSRPHTSNILEESILDIPFKTEDPMESDTDIRVSPNPTGKAKTTCDKPGPPKKLPIVLRRSQLFRPK